MFNIKSSCVQIAGGTHIPWSINLTSIFLFPQLKLKLKYKFDQGKLLIIIACQGFNAFTLHFLQFGFFFESFQFSLLQLYPCAVDFFILSNSISFSRTLLCSSLCCSLMRLICLLSGFYGKGRQFYTHYIITYPENIPLLHCMVKHNRSS